MELIGNFNIITFSEVKPRLPDPNC